MLFYLCKTMVKKMTQNDNKQDDIQQNDSE